MQIAHSTPFPNQVLDEYWPKVSPTEAKILGTIIRSTLGWLDKHTGKRKTRDWISHSQMALRSHWRDHARRRAGRSPEAALCAGRWCGARE